MTAEGPPPQSTTDEGADEPGEDPAIVYWVSLDGRVTRAEMSDEHITHVEHDHAGLRDGAVVFRSRPPERQGAGS